MKRHLTAAKDSVKDAAMSAATAFAGPSKRFRAPDSPNAAREPVIEEVVIRLTAPKKHLVTGKLESTGAAFNARQCCLKFDKADFRGNHYIQFYLGPRPGKGKSDEQPKIEKFETHLSIFGPAYVLGPFATNKVELEGRRGGASGLFGIHESQLEQFKDSDMMTVEAKIRHVIKHFK
ncbi:hypothetical protein Ddc_11044 [Ditylenchus destructor]|nr:hypothetical protein Ddc_11044 [Ditylenchus destructor]